ncbi:hypothetical protein V2J09_009244 [Rumex salicifolius]
MLPMHRLRGNNLLNRVPIPKLGSSARRVHALCIGVLLHVDDGVYRNRYYYEMNHRVSPDQLRELTNRIPGLAIFYSKLAHEIPPIFEHYDANIPTLHSVLVFLSFKSLPISKVLPEERFLFRRIQSKEDYYIFRMDTPTSVTSRSLSSASSWVASPTVQDESFVRMLKNSKKNDDIVVDDDSRYGR